MAEMRGRARGYRNDGSCLERYNDAEKRKRFRGVASRASRGNCIKETKFLERCDGLIDTSVSTSLVIPPVSTFAL